MLIASLLFLPLLTLFTPCIQKAKAELLVCKIWEAGNISRTLREARAGKEQRGEWSSTN